MVFCNLRDDKELFIKVLSHNPYFNRWFSAIELSKYNDNFKEGHNPYFNRWFSAIGKRYWLTRREAESQSLF